MLNDVCLMNLRAGADHEFSGIKEFLKAYQERAKQARADPLGFYVPPYAYAAWKFWTGRDGDEGLRSKRDRPLFHANTFDTLVGKCVRTLRRWAKARVLYVQYRGIVGNNLQQFKEVG